MVAVPPTTNHTIINRVDFPAGRVTMVKEVAMVEVAATEEEVAVEDTVSKAKITNDESYF